MQDLRQTPQYSAYMKSLGWKVVVLNNESHTNYVYLRKFPLIGTVAKLQRPSKPISNSQFSIFNKTYMPSIFYFEPSVSISFESAEINFQPAKSPYLPPKTIIIDLTKSEKELLTEMKPKTRYNIGLSKRKGVVIKESKDIKEFNNLWFKSSFAWGNWLPQNKEIEGLYKHFGKRAKVLMAYDKNNTLLAGLLLVCSKDTAFYMYVGSNKKGKELFAPTLLAWEAIRISKRMKLKYFDFEGIFDERYSDTKHWKGFTKFKEGFGGKVVEFPRTLAYHSNIITKLLF